MAKRKKGRAVNGIIVVNKPIGLSSNQVLQRVKRLFNAQKAGHTGALDPLATGVLPICLGEATKLSQVLLDADKAYRTTATLGEIRTTGDAEGEVVQQFPVPEIATEQLADVLEQFRGEVEQIPPMFSALKLNGKPLYELARTGLSTEEMQAVAEKKRRIITIHELLLEDQRPTELDLFVCCSKGTYIRTLVEDIGQALNCGAYVSMLHRTACGPFSSEQMLTLEELEQHLEAGTLDDQLMPVESAVPHWPQVKLDPAEANKMLLGQAVNTSLEDQPWVQLWAFNETVQQMFGIGRIESGYVKAQRLFQLPPF